MGTWRWGNGTACGTCENTVCRPSFSFSASCTAIYQEEKESLVAMLSCLYAFLYKLSAHKLQNRAQHHCLRQLTSRFQWCVLRICRLFTSSSIPVISCGQQSDPTFILGRYNCSQPHGYICTYSFSAKKKVCAVACHVYKPDHLRDVVQWGRGGLRSGHTPKGVC